MKQKISADQVRNSKISKHCIAILTFAETFKE